MLYKSGLFSDVLNSVYFQFSSQGLNAGVKVVSLKWLENCFKKGRLVDTEPYEITEQKKDSDL